MKGNAHAEREKRLPREPGCRARRSQRLEISSLQAQFGMRSFDGSNRLVHTLTEPTGQ